MGVKRQLYCSWVVLFTSVNKNYIRHIFGFDVIWLYRTESDLNRMLNTWSYVGSTVSTMEKTDNRDVNVFQIMLKMALNS